MTYINFYTEYKNKNILNIKNLVYIIIIFKNLQKVSISIKTFLLNKKIHDKNYLNFHLIPKSINSLTLRLFYVD